MKQYPPDSMTEPSLGSPAAKRANTSGALSGSACPGKRPLVTANAQAFSAERRQLQRTAQPLLPVPPLPLEPGFGLPGLAGLPFVSGCSLLPEPEEPLAGMMPAAPLPPLLPRN